MQDFTLILGIVGAIAVFMLAREIFCWYAKINQQIRIQQITLETLLRMYEQNGGEVKWDQFKKELGK